MTKGGNTASVYREIFKEEADRHPVVLSDFIHRHAGNTVLSAFVFLDLLERHAQHPRQVCLRDLVDFAKGAQPCPEGCTDLEIFLFLSSPHRPALFIQGDDSGEPGVSNHSSDGATVYPHSASRARPIVPPPDP